MRRINHTRETVLSGMFITFGIVLPVVFHLFGLGSNFLPMHIPVLLAGFVLSTPYAAAVGAVTPLLSSVITGMPPMFPVAAYMIFELAAYSAAASVLSRKFRLNTYISLIGSMAVGRIVAGIAVWVITELFGAKLPGPVAFIGTAIMSGLPGIIIQLVFIPPMILLLKKTKIIEWSGTN